MPGPRSKFMEPLVVFSTSQLSLRIYCTNQRVNNCDRPLSRPRSSVCVARMEFGVTPENFAYLSEKAGGTVLLAYVQPRAAKSGFSGTFRGRLKIRLNSPPVEGEANRECVELLSKALGISRSEIKLLRGEKSREKTFLISRPLEFVSEKFRKAGLDPI